MTAAEYLEREQRRNVYLNWLDRMNRKCDERDRPMAGAFVTPTQVRFTTNYEIKWEQHRL